MLKPSLRLLWKSPLHQFNMKLGYIKQLYEVNKSYPNVKRPPHLLNKMAWAPDTQAYTSFTHGHYYFMHYMASNLTQRQEKYVGFEYQWRHTIHKETRCRKMPHPFHNTCKPFTISNINKHKKRKETRLSCRKIETIQCQLPLPL